MPKTWTEAKLNNFITSGIEESLTLEYKAAEALDRSEYKKKEMTKDVSAMANSAGGTIVYGISEFSAENRRHLPEKITPVNRNEFPREWVEQIINAIRPRIDGIVIHSVNLSSGETHTAYIIEIPQSNTAHQASDNRYYKRFNFQSVPMEDYEVRDVIFREQTPDIILSFLLEVSDENGWNLTVKARNQGSAFAQYVACLLDVPTILLREIKNKLSLTDGGKYYRQRLFNLNQEFGDENFKANFPLLRSMSMSWKIPFREDFSKEEFPNLELKWKLYADNALPKEGKISIGEIETVDLRSRTSDL
ncbi:MAG: ATP-binding protein [Pyrinomonadaceae bacterium]